MRKEKSDIVCGLDIGSTKTCAVVGEIKDEGIDIIGIGLQPSTGIRKGVVVDIEATVASIRAAIDEAERMAGCEIGSVYTGIAGGRIKGFNSWGIVAVKGKEVRAGDVARVMEAAKAVAVPVDREIIQVLPQEFVVDDQDGIREPLGMVGVRLEAKVHIVTGAYSSAQNIINCAKRTGLTVSDIVAPPLASAEAVLDDDERELGVALVDIGGGTTDIAVFANGSLVHSAVIPLGGSNLTSDLSIGLRTSQDEAERIKKKYGAVLTSLVDREETVEVPPATGRHQPRTVSRLILTEILQPRIEEILMMVRAEVERSGSAPLLNSGLVLTGGTSLLPGIGEFAEQLLGVPVRCGNPRGVGGLTDVVKSPTFSNGVGLVVYGAKKQDRRSAFLQ